ncbi:hypothetical protein Leryth_016429 [Lithospermum erythrorhizon]|nr:hypothetical protein Leryth_016429 [Lithospermum erythrorhizon]
MWLRRTKSTAPCHVTSPTFVRSSFKDIESLFAEENNNQNQNDNNNNNNNNNSPKSQIGNVFHRVRRAQSFFWAFTNPPKIEQNVPHRKNVPNHQENTPNRRNVPNEENVEGLIHNSKSLHCGGNDDGGVTSEGNGEGLMQSSKLLVEDDGGVTNEENVEESIRALKSLHCRDKGHDGGVVVGRGGSGGSKECVVEEAIGIGEVVDANVVGNDDGGVVRIELPGTETLVVIFFTSLRVIRSTFLDCKYVRSILHSFRVAIDERDLFMDGRFMAELQRIMCIDEKTNLTLPRVFIGGRYIGGAEEIRQLHEAGELKKYLEGMAPAPAGTCEVCGGHGFILCIECNGSHKCYADKGAFKTCTGCNENGLVREIMVCWHGCSRWDLS